MALFFISEMLKFKSIFIIFFFYYSVRSIVVLNLHNYGSGRHPWGHPKPEYLEKVCILTFFVWNASYLYYDNNELSL